MQVTGLSTKYRASAAILWLEILLSTNVHGIEFGKVLYLKKQQRVYQFPANR